MDGTTTVPWQLKQIAQCYKISESCVSVLNV